MWKASFDTRGGLRNYMPPWIDSHRENQQGLPKRRESLNLEHGAYRFKQIKRQVPDFSRLPCGRTRC
jgi:hypothetical protein